MSTFISILPLAIVMVAGPQIVSAIFLATSEHARKSSIAYLLGVATAVGVGLAFVFVVASAFGVERSSSDDAGKTAIDYAIIALLLLLMVRVYLRRNQTEPPKWMGKLATATPAFSFKLGFLLFIAMPTDVITMITVGTYLVREGEPLISAIPFVLLTLLLVSTPLLILLLLGDRATVVLPKIREWMNANSWLVSEFVIAFFVVLSF